LRKRLLHPLHSGMRPIFHLDPVFGATAAIRTVASLGNQALEPKLTGLAKEVGTDLALFEAAREDAVRSPMQQPFEASLQRQGQGMQVIAVHRKNVENIKLVDGEYRTVAYG
jgi:hypothetical protein